MSKPPLRMCVVCRKMKDKRELIRVVRGKDGNFALDRTGKASGRGAYVCADEECISRLDKVKGLERAFKGRVPSEIKEEIKQMGNNSENNLKE